MANQPSNADNPLETRANPDQDSEFLHSTSDAVSLMTDAGVDSQAFLGERDAEDIEHAIDRLKTELSERRCDDRPLPGSVERAYQVTIDKYYARLEQCKRRVDIS